jgi:serine/threonine protein phosphatase PrpC
MTDQKADTAEHPVTAKLFKHFGPSPAPVQVSFGALTHPGKVRPNNEDHYLVVRRQRSRTVLLTNLAEDLIDPSEDNVYVLAVADGMGGAAFGEFASMLALRSAFDLGHSVVHWVFRITDAEISDLHEQLEAILQLVHRELVERAQIDRSLTGMGTTLTGAYLIGLDAFIAHVGDSRVYRFHAGVLQQLTRDHTVAQEWLDAGMSGNDPATRHILTNCLGGSGKDIAVDFQHVRLEDHDRLLFCTDGLSDMVPEAEIARALGSAGAAQQTCAELIELALRHGGKDNITAIVVDFELPTVSLDPSSV